jgi:5-methyltetrahydropteroyltriglutamate--homocysteine methyltransferase
MQRSTDHILTSHVGTLPRPAELQELLARADDAARAEYFERLPTAVEDIVQRQLDVGLDVINDGEFGKIGGFSGYVRTRLAGWEQKPLQSAIGREQREQFPSYSVGRTGGVPASDARPQLQMVCTGPVSYIGQAELDRDLANMAAAVASRAVPDVFMAAVSPDNVNYQPGSNEYYKSEEELVLANAAAIQHEYKAITDAGYVLQIDMPVMKYNALSLTVEQFRSRFARLIEILNEALSGIDPDQVRVHVCYGGMKIAHTGDLMLDQYIDLLLALNANGISYDQNVRHDHEWTIFEDLKLPDGKLLMPGVVAHTTDVVEHPQVVAERLVRLANLVGRENVIAGTDCGLGGRVHEEIAWAKFGSMVEGARLASEKLF